MQFKALIALSAVTGALAAEVYPVETAYATVDDKTYTSVSTCTGKDTVPTSVEYEAPAPTEYESSEVTYTSLEYVTVTSCGDYVTNCPAETYTSTAISVSTCTGKAATDYYVPPANTTDYYVPPADYPTSVYSSEVPYETPVYETTVYTTVCPSEGYCYATTVTTTYCPGKPTSTYVPVPEYPAETTTSCSTDVPVYTPPAYTAPSCPGGYDCPPVKNETTYVPPPSYTGAASANAVSFGVAAIAGLAALLIAA